MCVSVREKEGGEGGLIENHPVPRSHPYFRRQLPLFPHSGRLSPLGVYGSLLPLLRFLGETFVPAFIRLPALIWGRLKSVSECLHRLREVPEVGTENRKYRGAKGTLFTVFLDVNRTRSERPAAKAYTASVVKSPRHFSLDWIGLN